MLQSNLIKIFAYVLINTYHQSEKYLYPSNIQPILQKEHFQMYPCIEWTEDFHTVNRDANVNTYTIHANHTVCTYVRNIIYINTSNKMTTGETCCLTMPEYFHIPKENQGPYSQKKG